MAAGMGSREEERLQEADARIAELERQLEGPRRSRRHGGTMREEIMKAASQMADEIEAASRRAVLMANTIQKLRAAILKASTHLSQMDGPPFAIGQTLSKALTEKP